MFTTKNSSGTLDLLWYKGCFFLLFLVSQYSQALPINLQSAIDYALIHHPGIQHAKLDLEQVKYDLNVENDLFLPKWFWHSELFYEKESCYNSKGINFGPMVQWHFPTGTKISGNVQDTSRLTMSIKQPLIKNLGRKVNQNGLIQTHIQQDIWLLNYEKTLEDIILQVSTSYFNYAQTVLANRIQKNALDQAKKYLHQVHYLVETGRLAKNEAEQPALHVEHQESQKEENKQQLDFHYLMLLKSIGLIENEEKFTPYSEQIEMQIAQEIEALLTLFKKEYDRTLAMDFLPIDKEEQIYANQFKRLEQNKIMAKDELKWNMNVEGYANIREQDRQYGVSVSLDLPLNDKLKRYQTLYHLEVEKNKLNDLQQLHAYYYPKKISFEKKEIESKFKQLMLAIKMRALAEKSLKTAELKWQAGRTTLFELIQLSNQLQQSENELVKLKINILNTGFNYFKSLGMLARFWGSK